MSVLIVGVIDVQNPADLGPYKEAMAVSMQEFGIAMVGQARPTEMLEGEFSGTFTAILEIESEEKARAWHASDSYAKAIAARSKDAKFSIAIVPKAA